MANLFDAIEVRDTRVQNRIVFPPVVVFWTDGKGTLSDRHIAHYVRRAKGGVGLIVVEATAVLPEGRLSDRQLGIWADDFIPQFRKLTDECHRHGARIFVQLQHGGIKAHKAVTNDRTAPSNYETTDGERSGSARELSVDEICRIRDAFVEAAGRAHDAGFDGIELHGAHGYLLNQFASPRVNRRTDDYGGDAGSRLRLSSEIIAGIRSAVPDERFIVSMRMGCNDPDLRGSTEIARHLEASGIDMLHVSAGMGRTGEGETLRVADDFPLGWIVYGGTEIAKQVEVPVIVVNGIRTPEQAQIAVDRGADCVAMARSLLVDPDWPAKAAIGETPVRCLECKPCNWFTNGEQCPRFDPSWLE